MCEGESECGSESECKFERQGDSVCERQRRKTVCGMSESNEPNVRAFFSCESDERSEPSKKGDDTKHARGGSREV